MFRIGASALYVNDGEAQDVGVPQMSFFEGTDRSVINSRSGMDKFCNRRSARSPCSAGLSTACLSSLDALIVAQSRNVDGFRAHKEGLMQQLFPNPHESVSPRLAAGRGQR